MKHTELEAIVSILDNRADRSPLLPKQTRDRELESRIEALDWNGRHNETPIIALMAGLHLRNDSLDLSHSYAQQIEHDATGAYWHGIMHRMEGDFYNSKYWFRMAGHHPAMERTRQRVSAWLHLNAELLTARGLEGRALAVLRNFQQDAGWAPAPFVDLIVWLEQEQRQLDPSHVLRELLMEIQHIEMQELFDYTLEIVSSKG